MDTLKQFNLAMQYIEAHLADEIDFDVVARLACCSEYHFRRMFATLAGLGLSEYIRRRRLSQAALILRQTDDRVIDVAVKFGYDSADAFARAFQALHGVAPSQARLSSTSIKVIPPMTFQLTIGGGDAMEYRIIEKAAFYIVGLHKRVKLLYRGVNPEIAAMWELLSEADIETLDHLSEGEPGGLVNASVSFAADRSEGSLFDHYIGVVTTQADSTGKWAVVAVPASTWVVFTSRGTFPDALQTVWERIFTEWLLSSDYELADGPELLWAGTEEFEDSDFHAEIWIPVVKKQSVA
jgi:AraC family transcriptional regulator